jgi:hypothetical protein
MKFICTQVKLDKLVIVVSPPSVADTPTLVRAVSAFISQNIVDPIMPKNNSPTKSPKRRSRARSPSSRVLADGGETLNSPQSPQPSVVPSFPRSPPPSPPSPPHTRRKKGKKLNRVVEPEANQIDLLLRELSSLREENARLQSRTPVTQMQLKVPTTPAHVPAQPIITLPPLQLSSTIQHAIPHEMTMFPPFSDSHPTRQFPETWILDVTRHQERLGAQYVLASQHLNSLYMVGDVYRTLSLNHQKK